MYKCLNKIEIEGETMSLEDQNKSNTAKDSEEVQAEKVNQKDKSEELKDDANEIANEEQKEDLEAEQEAEQEETEEEEFISKEQADYRDKLLRKVAEFENYKKRTNEEFLRLIESANENLILKLLPVLDDIHRFYANYKEDMKAKDIKKGFDLIAEKLESVLEQSGLKAIDAIGKEFDPDLHEALLLVEDNKVESNHIIDEHEKGYHLKDKVIRYSKVIVSK